MELSGEWLAASADEGLRRAYPAPDFDDRSWTPINVPGHWRSAPAFGAHDGPLLYRHRFSAQPPAEGRRGWLRFDGIFYQGDVWLDGSYVGVTEGYFFPHVFEITGALRDRDEHVLGVEVTCTRPADRAAKRNLTGVFQHWDCIDPEWNPGGIWRPVRVDQTGPVRIKHLRVLCTEATAERAVIEVRAVLDSASAVPAVLRTTITSPSGTIVAEGRDEHRLATGENRFSFPVRVDQPQLWWPHALGEQPLHDLTLSVSAGDSGEISDEQTRRTGLRQVRMKRWIMTVNGERLFLKGANQGPSRVALAEATAGDLERDVVLAKQAGLDLLRVHAHVSRPELYDAADRHGLLLWQDLPLQWGYARTVRKQAVRQAREAVDLLGHHPSIALWCGHNEPFAIDGEPSVLRLAALQELPTWNKTFLDTSIKRALGRADRTRPVVPHSGVLPGPFSGGTDSHLYLGWYVGVERDFPRLLAAWPRLARFVTEFGAQAVPDNDEFMGADRWPDLEWDRLGRSHALQRKEFDRYVPPGEHDSYKSWRAATQAYQAELLRFHVETLRRLKYRPSGGFCQFSFADGSPAVTWSVLDHLRVAKPGYQALATACAPVVVVATRPPATYAPGERLLLDVHAVSDLRGPLGPVTVTATLAWPGGGREWTWAGELAADACAKVGTVRADLPARDGAVTLDLRLAAGDVQAVNRYESRIQG